MLHCWFIHSVPKTTVRVNRHRQLSGVSGGCGRRRATRDENYRNMFVMKGRRREEPEAQLGQGKQFLSSNYREIIEQWASSYRLVRSTGEVVRWQDLHKRSTLRSMRTVKQPIGRPSQVPFPGCAKLTINAAKRHRQVVRSVTSNLEVPGL